ncbi:MAG: acyl carrier protein [Pseudomonadales bacterium]|nr:acyl carrier protein [Pseudomonadales bacterium]MCP5185802.1 acyl carrier protein [Pseudomonadales bacterium]
MQSRDATTSSIRQVLQDAGNLAVEVDSLTDIDDLYDAGLTSLNTVNLMLAIEDLFGIEFPDEFLNRDTFQSINAIADAVVSLGGGSQKGAVA